MSNCPRCGAPLDPDSPRCFGCAQGVTSHLDVTRPERSLSRNAGLAWFWGGGAMCAVVAGAGWVVLVVLEAVGIGPFSNGFLALDALIVFTLMGVMLGASVGLVWKALLRPVLLALFASKTFEREYGTPEEQGIVRKRKSGED
jgi:hypothetical protein